MSTSWTFRRWLGEHLPNRLKLWIWFATDSSWRRQYRAEQRAIRSRQRARRLAIQHISSQTNNVVASGPFAGMKYIPSWGHTHFTQKLLGTYEKELAGIVEEICERRYQLVIDVGAAEGYYACGLMRRMPDARMKAFELQEQLHPALRRIAAENALERRLELFGACTQEALRRELDDSERCLVVCDVDGVEIELLDPAVVPQLLKADLLVEVHDGIRPNVSGILTDRFRSTHVVEFIAQVPRGLDDLPAAIRLDPELALKSMDEGRGAENDWLWMRSKVARSDRERDV
jgi:hypothetical protein